MKKIITLTGVTVDNDALPRVAATASEQALASIPGLFLWLQAGGKYQAGSSAFRDRAGGGLFTTAAEAHQLWGQVAMTGGRPAIQGPDANAANYLLPENAAIRPDQWAMATVLEMPSSLAGANNSLLGLVRDSEPGVIAPRIAFNPKNTLLVYGPETGVRRLEYTGEQWSNKPALIVLTFSTERGFALRVNGHLVAENAADRRPLNETEFQIGQSTALPAHPNTFGGRLGHLLMFNADLTAVENAGYLRVLERELMGFYGIS